MESNITLADAVKYYEDAAEETKEARARSERDRDYYDHKQLTSAELAELQKRNQPATIINYCQKNVNHLLGAERKVRRDPKAYPRAPMHEEAAHAASDAIRYVADNNKFDVVSSNAYENLLIEGICGGLVEVERKGDEANITITRIAWDRIFYDPHSRERDFSDASYKGYISWMDESEARFMAKQYGYTGEFSDESEQFGSSYEDKPSYQRWYDSTRKRVKICYLWALKQGQWQHMVYSKAGVIWGPKPSIYLDDDGEHESNLILASAQVDRENNRYGYLRAMISQQDAINKRDSKATHLLSQRQTWAKKGAFANINQAKRELAKPDGHVEVEEGRELNKDFGVLSTGDMALGHFQLLQNAKNDISIVASTGSITDQGAQSGRELEIRSISGNLETVIYVDTHKQWKNAVYRCVWNKIKQFWDAEKWVRVTDDEDNLKWVGLNVPVTLAEQMVRQKTGMSYSDIREKYGQQLQAILQQRPELAQIVETENRVAELDVDIILDEQDDVVNVQSEQFMTIAKIAERRGDIPTSLLIKMSQLRNKEQILDELTGGKEQQQIAAQQQQIAQEIQLRMADAEIKSKEADILHKQAQTVKTQEDAKQSAIENQLMLAAPEPPQIIV